MSAAQNLARAADAAAAQENDVHIAPGGVRRLARLVAAVDEYLAAGAAAQADGDAYVQAHFDRWTRAAAALREAHAALQD